MLPSVLSQLINPSIQLGCDFAVGYIFVKHIYSGYKKIKSIILENKILCINLKNPSGLTISISKFCCEIIPLELVYIFSAGMVLYVGNFQIKNNNAITNKFIKPRNWMLLHHMSVMYFIPKMIYRTFFERRFAQHNISLY